MHTQISTSLASKSQSWLTNLQITFWAEPTNSMAFSESSCVRRTPCEAKTVPAQFSLLQEF